MSHNNQKKIALVNDITGFGRCSAAVQLPIISQLRVQCCVLPTSILSNHTGFESFSFQDFTPYMEEHIAEWKKLGLRFNGICTGFLGSEEQISIVSHFIDEFNGPETIVMVDPVMGDEGHPYATYTPAMCQRMRELVAKADIVAPNLTEACIIANRPYHKDMNASDALEIARELVELGPKRVIVTGIEQENLVINACCDLEGSSFTVSAERLGGQRSGTGDAFSAIIAADAVNGIPFEESVQKASQFVKDCVQRSIELEIPTTDGLCFEEKLYTLK